MNLTEKAVDLAKAAELSLNTGTTFQSTIREILDSIHSIPDILNAIIEGVQMFRNDAEITIKASTNPAETRKRVNNIVNDISRLTRLSTGHSIVMKSRKGGFNYESRVALIKVAPVAAPVKFMEEIARLDGGIIDSYFKANFALSIKKLIAIHGEETIGREVATQIKLIRDKGVT